MAKGNSQKTANGSTLQFEAQLWAAAEQAVPAPNCRTTEYNGAHRCRRPGGQSGTDRAGQRPARRFENQF